MPANDQAPVFKDNLAQITLSQSGSATLSQSIFDVEDPDTALNNLLFKIEKVAENADLELHSKGRRYILKKDESFTVNEVRNGTFRLNSKRTNVEKDSLKISVADGMHLAVKTIFIEIQVTDKVAPRVSNQASMLLTVQEGQAKQIRRENLAYVDDKSSTEEIMFTISNRTKLIGKLFLGNQLLQVEQSFTQADIDLQNLR